MDMQSQRPSSEASAERSGYLLLRSHVNWTIDSVHDLERQLIIFRAHLSSLQEQLSRQQEVINTLQRSLESSGCIVRLDLNALD